MDFLKDEEFCAYITAKQHLMQEELVRSLG